MYMHRRTHTGSKLPVYTVLYQGQSVEGLCMLSKGGRIPKNSLTSFAEPRSASFERVGPSVVAAILFYSAKGVRTADNGRLFVACQKTQSLGGAQNRGLSRIHPKQSHKPHTHTLFSDPGRIEMASISACGTGLHTHTRQNIVPRLT